MSAVQAVGGDLSKAVPYTDEVEYVQNLCSIGDGKWLFLYA